MSCVIAVTTFVAAEVMLYQNQKTTGYGTESVCFLGPRIRHAMPSYIKESQTLSNFRRKIQRYDFDCTCRLCRLYIRSVGFLKFLFLNISLDCNLDLIYHFILYF